jgi:hypothetical protein
MSFYAQFDIPFAVKRIVTSLFLRECGLKNRLGDQLY